MAIQINGDGTITGINVGGLPNGIVDTDMLAANSVASGKIASGAITAAKLASGVGGKVLQVISNVETDVVTLSNQQSWTAVPGSDQNDSGSVFAIAITPTTSTSKFLVNFELYYAGTSSDVASFRWQRGSTALTKGTNTGNRVSTGASAYYHGNNTTNISPVVATQTLLDSPNTTSQIIYAPYYYKYHSDTAYLNRSIRDYQGSTYDTRCCSQLTVMEIAA
jgi:hypothetical protein